MTIGGKEDVVCGGHVLDSVANISRKSFVTSRTEKEEISALA